MRFSELSPIAPSSRSLEREIQTTAEALKIDPHYLSLIRGVINWRVLLEDPKGENHGQIKDYIRLAGGAAQVSKLVTRALRDDCSQIKEVSAGILEDARNATISGEWLLSASPQALRRVYPAITNSQARLLQVLVKHRLQLDRLDLSQVSKMLPFPLDEGSYLWRFIAGGCETPQHALRHLVGSTPFLVTMRNLFEGLAASSNNFIEVVLAKSSRNEEQGLPDPCLEAVEAMVNSSHDLYGPHARRGQMQLRWILVPNLPFFNDNHIPFRDRHELAKALFDWLFFGDASSDVLWRTNLPPERERQAQKWREEIDSIRSELKALRRQKERTAIGDTRTDKLKVLQKRLRNRESRLEAIEDQRDGIIPIGRELETFEKYDHKLKEFRSELRRALSTGGKPVFCFLSSSEMRGMTPWLELLDDAYSSPKAVRGVVSHRSGDVLSRCSYILDPETAAVLRRGSGLSDGYYCRRNMRRFQIDTTEINASVARLLSGVVPSRVAPELGELLSMVVQDGLISGVGSQQCLTTLVQHQLGKRTSSAIDYFSFVCERANQISPETMQKMLECLHTLGSPIIPSEIIAVCEARFGLSHGLFQAYHEYSKKYQPERFGTPGSLFVDITSLNSFVSTGLDAVGMQPELKALEEALCESKVVAVVDSTSYYPQFESESTLRTVMTDEVWGEYVAPTSRLIRSLALRIMNGEVSAALRNSSLLVPVVPDSKEQAQHMLLKMLLGFDSSKIDTRGETLNIVAEIARYNENAIVVLDATQVKNLEDYSQLLETLESFQVRTILCTRQKFPVVRSVFIDPFPREKLVSRVLSDRDIVSKILGLEEMLTPDVVTLAVEQVKHSGPHQSDPLHLTLQVLRLAAIRAKALGERSIVRPDLVDAASKIFNLSSPEQMERHMLGVEAFRSEAKQAAFGQDRVIDALAGLMRRHLLRLRPDRGPLVVLLAGPTGTGKTLLAELLAKNLNLPLEIVEGSQYTSHHQISRLIGSPADYRGPDEGKLFKFVYANPSGIVFIDEFEKMEQSFLPYLMNFLDRGTLESGDGKVTHRPSLTIILASNAGADNLRPSMDEREVRKVINRALSHGRSDTMQWLVARMQILGVLGLDSDSFKGALRKSLQNIQYLKGVWGANLELAAVDDSACALLFEATKDICRFDPSGEGRRGSIGFDRSSGTETEESDDIFIDMRHVEKSVTALVGPSLDSLVQEQYRTGRHADRTKVYRFSLFGDVETGLIKAVLDEP